MEEKKWRQKGRRKEIKSDFAAFPCVHCKMFISKVEENTSTWYLQSQYCSTFSFHLCRFYWLFWDRQVRWLNSPSCDWCRKPTSPWLTLWWRWLPKRRWAGWIWRWRRSRWVSGLRGRTLCCSGLTGWDHKIIVTMLMSLSTVATILIETSVWLKDSFTVFKNSLKGGFPSFIDFDELTLGC